MPAIRLGAADRPRDALAVLIGPDGQPDPAGAAAAADAGLDLAAVVERYRPKSGAGEVTTVPLLGSALRTLHLVGIGDADPDATSDADMLAWRRAGGALGRRARDEDSLDLPLTAGADGLRRGTGALVEGLLCGTYRFRAAGAQPKPAALTEVRLQAADAGPAADADLARAVAAARVTLTARDLANTPSLVKTPQWLAEQAQALADGHGLTVRIRDEQALAAEGFGGVLAVGAGSTRPPRLIELSYRPRNPVGHVVLVGKGITFDSGGLSLKPNDGMVAMKTDMAGGAAVLAAMSGLADLGVRLRVTGLVPAAENLPSGTAARPGDVVRHWGGRTTEVFNTDAEGRLVLADALAYAAARLRPDAVVDLATLTGAATLGLGRRHAALYATDESLAAELLTASGASGERLWRMPLVEDYLPALTSHVADSAQVGRDRTVHGGSIVAALFLRPFAGGLPWAHLDIAGPARADADADDVSKGATGFGARLLLGWLAARGQASER